MTMVHAGAVLTTQSHSKPGGDAPAPDAQIAQIGLDDAQQLTSPARQNRRGDRRKRIGAFLALSASRLRRYTSQLGARSDGENARPPALNGSPDITRSPLGDEQFCNTLELLPFAILVTDQRGQIVFANAGTEKLFGYSREELIGRTGDTLIPGWRGGMHVVGQGDGGGAHPVRAVSGIRDMVARRKEGTEFPAEITTNPVSSDGEALMLTVVIDRTERYELQRNRQELAHLTRVSTLGELAGSLAHELNQPLTAILSNAQAAQRFMAMEPINLNEVREILRDLVEDNHRATEVIRRIRALVKKGELEAAPLSLADVIGDVVLLLHSDAIVRGIRVFLDVDSALPPVRGDRVQLQQVVLNLLLNAFDAMESHAVADSAVAVVASLDSDGSVRVAVRDQGAGLAADILDRLFIPFFTSKRDGLGLGLSISRSIVEMHGGRIWAENNADRGATFYFTLPAEAASGAASVG